jgi:hypothetical protein
MSLLLIPRKIKTKNLFEEKTDSFAESYKNLDFDGCDKIVLLKGYSFDARITYHYAFNKKIEEVLEKERYGEQR